MGELDRRRVLLVEDDDDAREPLVEILQAWGFDVEIASDGVKALEIARKVPLPSAILLDLFLPVMSGWEVVAELQKSALLSKIPLVVVSACVNHRARTLPPADAHLAKPLDLGRLQRTLNRLC